MLPSMMSQEYIRKRYPTVTDHGNTVTNYAGTPAVITVYGSMQPGTGETDFVNRDGVEVDYTMFGPLQDIKYGDMIALSDGDYKVSSRPERWETGVLDHMVVRLSRWEG